MYLLVKKDEGGQKGWSKRIRVKFTNKPTFLTKTAIFYRKLCNREMSDLECRGRGCKYKDVVVIMQGNFNDLS